MSRLMNYDQHKQLMQLRNNINAALIAGDNEAMWQRVGILQGYLIGLHAAQEIDFGDLQALEAEVMDGIAFLVNARRAGNAH